MISLHWIRVGVTFLDQMCWCIWDQEVNLIKRAVILDGDKGVSALVEWRSEMFSGGA